MVQGVNRPADSEALPPFSSGRYISELAHQVGADIDLYRTDIRNAVLDAQPHTSCERQPITHRIIQVLAGKIVERLQS
jgi:hypothetical protein